MRSTRRGQPRAPRAKAGRRAYTTSKLGVIYLVHEFARRSPEGGDVYSFDPLMMPGTGLAREGSAVGRLAAGQARLHDGPVTR